jgi:hypothetical protein
MLSKAMKFRDQMRDFHGYIRRMKRLVRCGRGLFQKKSTKPMHSDEFEQHLHRLRAVGGERECAGDTAVR